MSSASSGSKIALLAHFFDPEDGGDVFLGNVC
jgi:hypothetical protein